MPRHKGLVRMYSRDIVPGIKYVSEGVNLCRLNNGLICIGCCGFDFAKDLSDKNNFIQALKKNTKEYQNSSDILNFKSLYHAEDLHKCGLCRNLVLNFKDVNNNLNSEKHIFITCPLHPAENEGKDLRTGECDSAFMCETQRLFHNDWGDYMKNKFIDFILLKDLDWFEYSKKMQDSSLLNEFLNSFYFVTKK